MERFQEKDLPLRCVLRMQEKAPTARSYIASCQHIWEQAVADGRLINGSVFAFEDQLFVYYESVVPFQLEEYLPQISEHVFMWPGQEKLRPYIPMVKLYQSLPMEEVRDWNRIRDPQPTLRISRMKLDTLQSYTYYHYLLQEEYPGCNGRYLGIWDIEDWCVLYNEKKPEGPIDTDYKGKLTTKVCPASQWRQYMDPHFYLWPDGELYQQAELILHVQ